MKIFSTTRNQKLIFFAVLVLLVLFKAFFIEHIHSKSLYDFDEARYAEVAKNVINTGNLLVPLAGGPDEPRNIIYTKLPNKENLYPYFWKPPLHTLIIALFIKLFGLSEVAIRLPSLLFAIGTMFLVYLLTKELFKKYVFAPFLASAFFISTNDFSLISSQGLAEAQLLFLSLLSILLALKRQPKYVILSGIFFGLAFMTKSFITFWIPLVVFYVLISRNIRASLRLIALFLSSSLVVILPWHLYMYAIFGSVFVDRYVLANIVGRVTEGQNAAPLQWYLIYMLDQWKPYIFVLPAFAFFLFNNAVSKKKEILLLFWIGVVLIPLSIARSKVFWYIFPMWVPLSILLASAVEQMFIEKKHSTVLASIILILFSLHPYWQLNFQHIPLKQFTFFFVVVSVFMYFMTDRVKKLPRIPFMVPVILLLVVANYFSIKEAVKRTDWNHDVKILMQRNQNMSHLYVVGLPYETALFYGNTGNIAFGIENRTRHLLIKTNSYDHTITDNFLPYDKEGDFTLLKRVR